MSKYILSFLLVFKIAFAAAQGIVYELDDYVNYANLEKTMAKPATYSNVAGSPFLFDDFVEGSIKLDNGAVYKGPLRYDIYADELEFKTTAGEIYTIENPGAIQFVKLGELNFNYFEEGAFANVKGFFEILVVGDYSLYKKHRIILRDPEAARPYMEAKPATFVRPECSYFMMDADGNFVELKNRKDLIFGGVTENQLSLYIKSKKIKEKDEKDLIRFVEFLNTK